MTEASNRQDADRDAFAAFGSLPDHPLSSETISLLQGHDSVTACIPVYQMIDSPDEIVGVLLKTESSAAIALYNPCDGVWERLFETETFENAYSDGALTARNSLTEKTDRVTEVYGEETVELIPPGESETFTLGGDTFADLLNSLPNSPVPREVLHEFRREPEVSEVTPHMYRIDSGDAILLTVTFTTYTDEAEQFGIAWFDTDKQSWEATFTMDAARLEDETDTEFEEHFDEAFEAVQANYATGILRTLTGQSDYQDWWDGTLHVEG